MQAPSSSTPAEPHLLDLLALLRGAARAVDVEALLVHGHARLALAPLNLGQPRFLLLLPHLQLLHHALIVALHLLPLLRGQPARAKFMVTCALGPGAGGEEGGSVCKERPKAAMRYSRIQDPCGPKYPAEQGWYRFTSTVKFLK